jgi:hypothetical protein
VALVEPPAALARRLEVGALAFPVDPLEHLRQQRRADALPLPVRPDPEQVEVVERAVRVVPVDRVHQLEEPRRVGAGELAEPPRELVCVAVGDGLLPGRNPERGARAAGREVRLVVALERLREEREDAGQHGASPADVRDRPRDHRVGLEGSAERAAHLDTVVRRGRPAHGRRAGGDGHDVLLSALMSEPKRLPPERSRGQGAGRRPAVRSAVVSDGRWRAG